MRLNVYAVVNLHHKQNGVRGVDGEMAQSPTASAQRPAPNQKVLPHKDDIQIKTGKGLVYRPPTSDAGGILVACTILGCWTALFIHALWFVKLPWAVTEGKTMLQTC